jgi:hypothetical protein
VEYKSKHYAENRDYYKNKNKKWIEDHKDQYLANAKRYREENKEKNKERYAEWESRNPLHSIWRKMKLRCYSQKCDHYYLYGGRGITVCGRWLGPDGYQNFERDMGSRPSIKHSIDRIDTNGNYEPLNCKWSTAGEQMRNRRNNVLITIGDETKCLKDWSLSSRVNSKTLEKRVKNGWPESELLSPADKNRPHRYGKNSGY